MDINSNAETLKIQWIGDVSDKTIKTQTYLTYTVPVAFSTIFAAYLTISDPNKIDVGNLRVDSNVQLTVGIWNDSNNKHICIARYILVIGI